MRSICDNMFLSVTWLKDTVRGKRLFPDIILRDQIQQIKG